MPGTEPRAPRGLEINDRTFSTITPTPNVDVALPGATYTAHGPHAAGSLVVWLSQDSLGCGKNNRVKLYRDGVQVSNDVAWSAEVDSSSGHDAAITLPVPAILTEGKHVYSVWLQSPCAGPIYSDSRIGAIRPARQSAPAFGTPRAAPIEPGVPGGLAVWHRGDTIRQPDQTPIARWPDSSGYGRSLVQATASNQPTYTATGIGGRPAVRFYYGASAQYLTWATYWATGIAEAEVFAVVSIDRDPPQGDLNGALWVMGGAGGDQSLYRYSGDGNWYDDWGANSRPAYGVPAAGSLASPRILNITSAPGAKIVRINGTQLYSTGTNTVAWPSSGNFGIGISGSAHGLRGMFAELIVYRRILGAGERSGVFAYLKKRYGIS